MAISSKTHQALEQRLEELTKEYEVVLKRLGRVIDVVEEERLKRRVTDLENEIKEIEAKLRDFPDWDGPQEVQTSPFKGLEAFEEGDAHLFFGRSKLTAELLAHLNRHNFLAVVGASGSGKSSVVRAGVIPKLKAGQTGDEKFAIPEGSSHWPVHIFTPDVHPLESLTLSLTRETEATKEAETLREEMLENARSLHLYVRKKMSARRDNGRFLLVVDQFEELFTRCRDEVERKAFVDNLLTAVHPETAGPTVIILVIRSDFVHRCIPYKELYQLIRDHEQLISEMAEDELHEAIEQPALQSGLQFSPGLVDHILSHLRNIPAPLPLLSHALYETWRRREGNELTFQGYVEAGEVQGAIAKTADRVYEQYLDVDQQAISWHIFRRLIELGETAFETRRRATLDELIPGPEQVDTVQKVLDVLARYRLITTSDTNVELTHEAIIANWPKLRHWLDANKEGLVIHNRLSELATEWNAHDRHEDFLVLGKRLALFEQWCMPDAMSVNPVERAFIEASRQKVEQLEKEKLLEKERIQQLARKELFEKRLKQVGIALALLTAVVLTTLALFRLPPFTPSWQWTNGPIGGDTWLPAINPNAPHEIYIGYARQGVYKSQDGGYSWFPANTGLSNRLAGNIIIAPETNTLFATAEGLWVYRSDDGGDNWAVINAGLPGDVIIRDIALDHGPPAELYMATWQYGIWSTPIDAINWRQKTWLGLKSPSIHQIRVVAGPEPILYASSSYQGIFKSLDRGFSWEQVAFPTSDVTQLGIAPWNSDLIYAYDAANGPYISQDGGVTWLAIGNQITQTPRSAPYFYDDGATRAIFIGTYDGQLFRSNESGDSWQAVGGNIPLATIRDVRIVPNTNDILLSTSSGVYVSNDAGLSWQLTGPEVLPVSVVVTLAGETDSGILAATKSGVHRAQIGEKWQTLNGGLGELRIHNLALAGNPLATATYAISDEVNLYKLDSAQRMWQPIKLPEGVDAQLIATGIVGPPSTLIVSGKNRLYQSSDLEHWRYLWQSPGPIMALVASPLLPETFYIATVGHGIFRSTDGGESWLPINNGLTNSTINDIATSAKNDQLLYAATNDGIFVSQDGGQSWRHATNGLTTRLVTSVAIHPRFDEMVYAGTLAGVFVSYNFGQSWRVFDRGLQSREVSSIAVDAQYVYLGTSRGVYYMKHPVIPILR
jgi:photosystem II stability/assembly factor-like uncharacterized protein